MSNSDKKCRPYFVITSGLIISMKTVSKTIVIIMNVIKIKNNIDLT